MTDLFRRREVLPEGRSIKEEAKLIAAEKPVVAKSMSDGAGSAPMVRGRPSR